MKEFWSPRIIDSVPYIPGEQPRGKTFIKLNTNENPYPPSERVLNAIRGAVNETLRLYPDPECLSFREAAARRHSLSPEQVFAGNGSDEILAFCFQAFFDPKKTILFPDITYSFYPVYADYFGLKWKTVALDHDFEPRIEQFFGSEGGVILANPNAPTGKTMDTGEIRRVLDLNANVVVLVDEAYVDFGGSSVVPLIPLYPNLVVVRTLSKSGALAGLRAGYAMGSPNLMNALRCVRDSINSYTVDRLALAGAAASLEDTQWFEETRKAIVKTREEAARSLKALGFTVYDSAANFLFVSHPEKTAKYLLDELRARGILVRWFDKPRISNCLRISVGTDEEMAALSGALSAILN